MRDSRFERQDFGEYREYLLRLGADNSRAHSVLLKNLSRAVREELTERQRELVGLYYVDRLSMSEIAQKLGVNVSTVSRTIKRGRTRLHRCLRYGARELLSTSPEDGAAVRNRSGLSPDKNQ